MKEISTDVVAKKLANKETLHLIDVREHEEVAQGMIPGAVHIPLGEVPHRLDAFDSDKEYILICRSGNRSGMAQEFLEQHGKQVINMAGGMLDWDGDVE